jgi:anti-anti-sigma factor
MGEVMELVITEHERCDRVAITGRIDSSTAPQIKEAINALIDDNHYNLIVDLKNVSFISSSGILTFIGAQKSLIQKTRGEIVFINVSDLVFSSFELAGLDTIFAFYDDFATAASRF